MATTSFVTDVATYILCPQPLVGTPSPSPSPEPTTQLDPKKYAIGQSDLWGPGPPSAIEKTHVWGQMRHQPEGGEEVLELSLDDKPGRSSSSPSGGLSPPEGTLETVSTGIVNCILCKMTLQVFGKTMKVS